MPKKRNNPKPASPKRTTLPRRADHTRQFVKDWKRLNGSGRYDMNKLKEAMALIIANDGPLPPEWKDHALTGEWSDHRECHIGGDFLQIYTTDDSGNLVVFTRAGSHSELFR